MHSRIIARLHALDRRRLPVQLGILITFALIPVWGRLPGAPALYSSRYFSGFAITIPLLLTIFSWLITGLPGFKSLRRNRLGALWALMLLLLALWASVSPTWAFVRNREPGVAENAALQLAIVLLFAITVASAGPPPRAIVAVLILSAVWSGFVAGLQVANQASIGLQSLGEFAISAQGPNVSVIQSGDLRWMRPYGLLPHPNVLGGLLGIGLLGTVSWIVSRRRALRWIGFAIFSSGLWVFLLTFSRGAWLGFAAGAFALYPLLRRTRQRSLWIATGLAVLIGILFISLYRPLVLSRAGVGTESIELRSVSDRLVFTSIAYLAVTENPVHGVGSGNFPWYASDYLFRYTDYDLRGDNVHQVFLSAWAELGIVGYGLVALALVLGVEAALRSRSLANAEDGDKNSARAVMLGGVIMLTFIGLFDHYPWTLIQFQVAWWGLLAAALAPGSPSGTCLETNRQGQP